MPPFHTSDQGSTTPMVSASNDNKTQQEWEYEVLEDLGTEPKAKLNRLGKEGWALITADPYIFRRPLIEDQKSRSRVGFARD